MIRLIQLLKRETQNWHKEEKSLPFLFAERSVFIIYPYTHGNE